MKKRTYTNPRYTAVDKAGPDKDETVAIMTLRSTVIDFAEASKLLTLIRSLNCRVLLRVADAKVYEVLQILGLGRVVALERLTE